MNLARYPFSEDLENLDDEQLGGWITHLGDAAKGTLMDSLLRDDATRTGLFNLLKLEQQNYIKAMEERLATHVQAAGPNPWVNLPIAASKQPEPEKGNSGQCFKVGSPQFTGVFRLEKLPAELILEIVRYLPRESAGALALVNKNIRPILSMKRLKPLPLCDHQTYWAYLQLLERDLYPEAYVIACPGCLRLHSFSITRASGVPSPCPMLPTYYLTRLDIEPFLRWPLNYNIVRALAIQRARGMEGAESCAQLLKAVSEVRPFLGPFLKQICTSEAFFNAGDELVFCNRIIIALHGDVGGVTGRSLSYFSDRYLRTIISPRPCDHQIWKQESLLGLDAYGGTFEELFDHDQDIISSASAASCLDADTWAYRVIFGDGASFLPRKAPCPQCATEASVRAQDLPGVRRVIILTSLKNLGGFGHWIRSGGDQDGGVNESQGMPTPTGQIPSKWKWETYRPYDTQPLIDHRNLIPSLAGCPRSGKDLVDNDIDEDFYDSALSSSLSISSGRTNCQELMDIFREHGERARGRRRYTEEEYEEFCRSQWERGCLSLDAYTEKEMLFDSAMPSALYYGVRGIF